MEQPLLYQMDMDGMAPWERFHLANVPEVPAPVRVKGIMEIRRSTHPTVLYQCGAVCRSSNSTLLAFCTLETKIQETALTQG